MSEHWFMCETFTQWIVTLPVAMRTHTVADHGLTLSRVTILRYNVGTAAILGSRLQHNAVTLPLPLAIKVVGYECNAPFPTCRIVTE